MIDPMRPLEPGDTVKALADRLERLERQARVPALMAFSAGATGVVSQAPTGSFVEFANIAPLSFVAPPSGRVLVQVYLDHTLQVSSGTPLVWTAPAIDDLGASESFAAAISSTSTPYTERPAIGKLFEGIEPGAHELSLYVKRDGSGAVLDYSINAYTLVVVPL